MATIRISEMLKTMETGKSFSMTVVSYNRKKKAGGKAVEYPEAILCQNTQLATADAVMARPLTPMEQMESIIQSGAPIRRNPNHKQHFTRNIQLLQDGHPTAARKKIHPPLVTKFNGATVLP